MNNKISVALFESPFIEIRKIIFVCLVLIIWFAVILTFPASLNLHPLIKTIIGWVWFLLPGLVLTKILFKPLSWIEQIPVAFVLSIGISTPITVYAILARISLDQFKWLFSAIFLLTILLYLIYTYRSRNDVDHGFDSGEIQRDRFPPVAFGYLAILIILVLIFCFISIIWPPSGDDLAGLPILADTLRFEQILGTEPFHGTQTPVTPRNELTVWIYQNTLVAHVSGINAVQLLVNSRAIFILISFLGLYTFLHQYFKEIQPALYLLCLWAIFLLITLYADGTGSDFVTRIVQDKFQGWFIVVPIVLIFVLWYLESSRKLYLVAVGIGILAATFMHPITFTQVLILTAGLSLIYFILNPSKETLETTTLLAIVMVLCLSVLIIQYFRYLGHSPIELVGLGNAVEYGRLNQAITRLRLWILADGNYILHPSIILQPAILFGYLLLPILIFRVRKDPAARLIVPTLIILPMILYIPQIAKIAGKFVTPYLLWRLAWPISLFAVLTIGWVIWLIIGKLVEPSYRLGEKVPSITRVLISLTLIIIYLFLGMPDIQGSLANFQERLADGTHSTCYKAIDVLNLIDQITFEEPSSILASNSLNYCIPGIAPFANVIEFRGYGTINRLPEDQVNESLQRVLDIEYFSSTNFVDELVASTIERYDVEYILVENDRMQLNMQFNQLSNFFQLIYSDHHFSLYRIKAPLSNSPIIDGNQALHERDWETAIDIFSNTIKTDQDNLLAFIGLGQAYEGNGDIRSAFKYFYDAQILAENEPFVHTLLADTYLLLHDPDNAIVEYKKALDRDPFRSEVHKSLANVYAFLDDSSLAIQELKISTSLMSDNQTAKYFSTLGTSVSSLGYHKLAEQRLNQAIDIVQDPDLYVDLAKILLNSDQREEAILSLRKAVELNPWLETPHYNLGLIYKEQEDYENAIGEFEISWRLNPTNQSAFKSLSSTIFEHLGEQAAISRMTDLHQLNQLLPGPQLGMAQIFSDNEEYERTLEILQNVTLILPKDTSITEEIGDLLYGLERYDQALSSYSQSLASNPKQTGAINGLSLLYKTAGEIDSQKGQLYKIARINPWVAWPHLSLSNVHQGIGDLETAIKESEWAAKLAPDDDAAYVTLGSIYQTQALFDLAELNYEKAIENEPESYEAYLKLAQIEIIKGNFESALSLIEDALFSNPDAIDVWLALGDYYYFLGDFQTAAKKFNKAIELDPNSPEAYLRLSETQFNVLDYQGSLITLKKSLEIIPDDLRLYQKYIDLLKLGNQLTEATKIIELAIKNNPNSSAAYVILANEYKRAGDSEQAILTFQHAIQLDPLYADAYYQLATVHKNNNMLEDAEQVYLNLFNIYPHSTSVYYNLGNLYIQQGQLDKARDIFTAMQDLPAKSADSYLGISRIYQIEGEWAQAIETLENAIVEVPNQSQSYQYLGDLYLQRGQVENARRVYEQALELNPSSVSTYETLTQIIRYLENDQSAEQVIQSALKNNPGSSKAYLIYASYLEEIGDLVRSENNYRSALQIDPTNPEIYHTISKFLLRQDRDEEALSMILNSLEVPLNSSEMYRYIGNTYSSLGDYRSAVDWYKQSIAKQPSDVNSLIALSAAYKQQSDEENALEALTRSVELQPNNIYARSTLAYHYKALGEVDRAHHEFTTICSKDPLQSDCHIALGNIAQDQGKWEESIQHYQAARKINPTTLPVYTQAGNTYRLQNMNPEALLEYTNGIRYSFDKQGGYLARAEFYESIGYYETARQDYQQAHYQNPKNEDSALLLAQFYKRRGELEKALSILTTFTELHASDAKIYNEIGNIHVSRGNLTEAINTHEQAIQLFSTEISLYANLANDLFLLGNTDDALRQLQVASENVSDSFSAYITLGDAYQTRLEYEQAQMAYQHAVDLEPSNISAIIKLDNLERKMGYAGLDLSSLENRSDIYKDSGTYITLGYQYQSRGDWQKAAESFDKAIELKPTNSYAWLALGTHYRTLQEFDRALEALTTATKLNPNNPDILLALGSVQKSLDMTTQAAATYERLIMVDRSRIDGYVKLAGLQVDDGSNAQAIETLYQGLNISPSGIEGYLAMANLLLEEGNNNDALEILNNATQLFPGAPELYIGQGEILAGEFLDIQQAYEVALENFVYAQQRVQNSSRKLEIDISIGYLRSAEELLTEAHTNYNNYLTMYELNLEDYQQAIDLYTHALKLKPDDEDAQLGLAKVAYAMGDTKKALTYYQTAIQAHPTSYNALNNLANTYLDINQPEDAAELFLEIIKYYPNYESSLIGLSKAYGAQDSIELTQGLTAAQSGQFRWIYTVEFLRARLDNN